MRSQSQALAALNKTESSKYFIKNMVIYLVISIIFRNFVG